MNGIEEVLSPENLTVSGGPRIVEVDWWKIIDSIGDPAIQVLAVLDDSTTDEERSAKPTMEIALKAMKQLNARGIEEFPYFRFITRSELLSERAA